MHCNDGLYLHALWETLFPIIKTHSYSEIWRALPPIRTQLVGKNYLLLIHIMGDTAPDNGVRKDACVDRRAGTVRRPPKSPQWFFKRPGSSSAPARLNTHTHLLADAAFVNSTV